ncbi:MAG: TrmH family RNA methyltransferase, partial [bacterium]|nr:TrmH family RNA methyltransferase [bacterium]
MIKKQKQKTGELVFGINPIVELLKARKRKLISIYTTKPEPKGWQQIEKLMPKYPVPIQYVSRDVLHRMAGCTDHQGILAWAQAFGFRQKPFEAKKQPFLIMVDSVQDPRNLGAIIRSAYCAGSDGVILSKKNTAPLNAVALKAAAGLAEYIEIYQSPSPEAAIQELKKSGYTIYLATFDGKKPNECSF